MHPEQLADLHALCFTVPRPWRADEFASLLNSPGIFLISHNNGFALGRIAGPEAELLTIAVHPDTQNMGHGRRLIEDFLCAAGTRGAKDVFLEVAENNESALALYTKSGFIQVAKRVNYFKQITGPAVTALVMIRSV